MPETFTHAVLQSLEPSGTVYQWQDLAGQLFTNQHLEAPPAPLSEVLTEAGVTRAGAELVEHNFQNAVVSLAAQLQLNQIAGAGLTPRQRVDLILNKLTGMFEDARQWHSNRQNTGRRLLLLEDSLGHERQSEIMDGVATLIDTLDSAVIDQGWCNVKIDMMRRPFRYARWINGWGLEGERLQNLFQEPSFLQNRRGGGAGAQFADHWFEIDPGAMVAGNLITTDYLQGGQCQQVTVAAPGVAGDCFIRTTRTAAGDAGYQIPVTAATEYHMVINVRHRTNGGNPVRIRVWDITGAAWIVPGAPNLLTFTYQSDVWEKQYVNFTTPAGCVAVSVYAGVPAADRGAPGVNFYIDKLMLGDKRDKVITEDTFVGWTSNSRIMAHFDAVNQNHGAAPDDMSHTNRLDVEGTASQVPPMPCIWIEDTELLAPQVASVCLGAKWQEVLDFEHWKEYQGAALAACSGGEYQRQAVNTATWTRLPDPIFPAPDTPLIVGADGNYGEFLIFAAVRAELILNFQVRAQCGVVNAADGVIYNGLNLEPIYVNETVAGQWSWLFLGVANFNRRDWQLQGWEPTYFGVQVWVYHSAGAARNFDIDFICLVPTESGVQRASFLTQGGDDLLLGWDDRLRGYGLPGGISVPGHWAYRGQTPRLNPRGTTRMIYQPAGFTDMVSWGVAGRLPTKIDWRPTYL